jgi:hypothetical protein
MMKCAIRMSAAMLACPDGDDWIAAEAASGKGLPVASRTIIRALVKQIRVSSVPFS